MFLYRFFFVSSLSVLFVCEKLCSFACWSSEALLIIEYWLYVSFPVLTMPLFPQAEGDKAVNGTSQPSPSGSPSASRKGKVSQAATLPVKSAEAPASQLEGILQRKHEWEGHNKKASSRWVVILNYSTLQHSSYSVVVLMMAPPSGKQWCQLCDPTGPGTVCTVWSISMNWDSTKTRKVQHREFLSMERFQSALKMPPARWRWSTRRRNTSSNSSESKRLLMSDWWCHYYFMLIF